MNLKHLLVLLVFPLFFSAKSQTVNPLDEKYTPPKSSLFFEENSKRASFGGVDLSNHSIKFPVLDLIRGEFRVLYEQKVFNNFSVEGGVGLSFMKDFVNSKVAIVMAGLWGDADYDVGWHSYDRAPVKMMLDNSSFESGFIYSIALRYYFPKVPQSPSFIDITCKRVNLEHYVSGVNFRSSTFVYNNTYLTLNLGFSSKSDHVSRQFWNSLAFGVGAKFGKWDEYLPNYAPFLNPVYSKSGLFRKGVSPLFTVKYVVGICW